MVLVTGATGLVGTHLLVKLIREKQAVRALYRSETKKEYAKKVFLHYCSEEGEKLFDTIQWVKATINDIPALSEAFDGVTYVYHCAAWISFNPKHYRELRKVNIQGTANIVNLCLINNVKKLCYISSIATLEPELTKSVIDETSEWNSETPKSVYAITKYGAEMEVWRGAQENLAVVIVNPGIIIGPGFYNGGSGYLFKKIHAGMKYYTTGTTGYVGIDDVVTIMHQLMVGNFSSQRYIVVGENLDYKTAFTMIAKALNKKPPSKEASRFLLNLAYYLQLASHTIFRTKRSIFKSSIQSVLSDTYYKNDKVKKALDYSFTPVQKSIEETATLFSQGF